MIPKQITALSLISLVWLVPASATTYRYVDENGVTIYSQSPPPSGKATIIKPPAPNYGKTDDRMEKLKAKVSEMEKARKEKKEAKKEKKKIADNAELKEKRCEGAKKDLSALEQYTRIKMKMKDGNYKMLTDEERASEIEKAKSKIKDNCN